MPNILGHVDLQLERWDEAAGRLAEGLDLARRDGYRMAEAHTLDGLGRLSPRRGDPVAASGHHRQALEIFRAIEDPEGEATALNGLGEAACAAGDPQAARTHHTATLAVVVDPVERARAHAGLGDAYRTLGEDHYRSALAIYTDLGMPDADRLRARLAEPSGQRSTWSIADVGGSKAASKPNPRPFRSPEAVLSVPGNGRPPGQAADRSSAAGPVPQIRTRTIREGTP
jgi:tetratricopeptide (TPR) repeat protein